MIRPILVALPLMVLAACDGGGDPVQQAMREASAEHHAAAVKDGEVSGHPVGHGPASPGSGDAAFAASETLMHQKMAAATGETVDQAYIAKMIAHHEGALAMAQVALAQSHDPEIRRMAQSVVDAQTREIAEMRAWRPVAQ